MGQDSRLERDDRLARAKSVLDLLVKHKLILQLRNAEERVNKRRQSNADFGPAR